MSHKIEISVYQHPLYEEGTLLFQEDPLEHLLSECEELFLKRNSSSNYPKEEVKMRFSKLFGTVSLAKSLRIKLINQTISWELLLNRLKRYYPQLVWTVGKEINGEDTEYWFEFIPLVLNQTGFPFGTSLIQSLEQQGVRVSNDEELVDAWIENLEIIVTDFLKITTSSNSVLNEKTDLLTALPDDLVVTDNDSAEMFLTSHQDPSEADVELLPKTKKNKVRKKIPKTVVSPLEEPVAELLVPVIGNENDLERENRELAAKVEALTNEIHELQTQSLALVSSPGQKLYYEEALRRESEEKERMRQTNAKLESLVNRLELQAQSTPFDLIESDFSYSERNEDWYKKRTIDLIEYDQLYRKAKYLEHTWQVNQHLTVTTERMTIDESKLTYERERFNRLKNSAKDIELFVMMDECKMINDRVKVRQGFLWMKPHVKIMNGDYENLVEKANYFDIIHSENKLLERIIEENDGNHRPKKRERRSK